MSTTTLSSLQQRLAAATERNRTNTEARARLLEEAKTKFGCDTAEELCAKRDELAENVRRLMAEEDGARQRAEEAVVAIEAAVGIVRTEA